MHLHACSRPKRLLSSERVKKLIFHSQNCQKYLSDSFKPLNQVVEHVGIPLWAGHHVTKNTHLPRCSHQCH